MSNIINKITNKILIKKSSNNKIFFFFNIKNFNILFKNKLIIHYSPVAYLVRHSFIQTKNFFLLDTFSFFFFFKLLKKKSQKKWKKKKYFKKRLQKIHKLKKIYKLKKINNILFLKKIYSFSLFFKWKIVLKKQIIKKKQIIILKINKNFFFKGIYFSFFQPFLYSNIKRNLICFNTFIPIKKFKIFNFLLNTKLIIKKN